MVGPRGLYQRFRQIIHEAAKFGIVGAVGFVINLAGADLLHYNAGLGKYTALTVATVLAMIANFLGNRYWTFAGRTARSTTHETVMFFALNGVALLIQYATLWLIDGALGLSSRLWYSIAVVLGIGLGTLFRFWSYRKWVWHAPPVGATPVADLAEVPGVPPASWDPAAAAAWDPVPGAGHPAEQGGHQAARMAAAPVSAGPEQAGGDQPGGWNQARPDGWNQPGPDGWDRPSPDGWDRPAAWAQAGEPRRAHGRGTGAPVGAACRVGPAGLRRTGARG